MFLRLTLLMLLLTCRFTSGKQQSNPWDLAYFENFGKNVRATTVTTTTVNAVEIPEHGVPPIISFEKKRTTTPKSVTQKKVKVKTQNGNQPLPTLEELLPEKKEECTDIADNCSKMLSLCNNILYKTMLAEGCPKSCGYCDKCIDHAQR